jgi:hypothetical protein
MPATGFLQDNAFSGQGSLFGGFSALHLSPDGLNFIAVSDHGAFVTGQFERDGAGRIMSISTGTVTPLLGRDGKKLKPGRTDSEGLAVAPDGTTYVSFEGPARVLQYPALGGVATNLPSPSAFAKMQDNRSLESLAMDAAGTLYTLPEDSGAADRPFPVFRFTQGVWDQPFSLPRRGPFLVSDATFGPDGRLYILERQFLGLGGFATRLRRFTLTASGATNEQTLLQTEPGTFDNLEGLAVWRDAIGLRATMIADDNYLPFFRSQIVEYRLPD